MLNKRLNTWLLRKLSLYYNV